MTRVPVYPRSFCLDANLSFRAADALKAVGLPFVHVSEHFPHKSIPGRCGASDETLIEWAGKTETVLVTADDDFQGIWLRQGTMSQFGTEVIVFDFMPSGPIGHLQHIIRNYERWMSELERQPYQQPERKELLLKQGKKAKAKVTTFVCDFQRAAAPRLAI
jgi:hypothetical protein